MKRYKSFAFGAVMTALLMAGAADSQAATYTFQSYDNNGNSNMLGLDHYYYYSWKLNWNLPVGQTITSARMDIYNIWDWTVEPNDILRVYLLDNPPTLDSPVTHAFPGYTTVFSSRYDNQTVDNWNGQGPLIGTWTDPYGGNNGANKVADLVFNLSASNISDLTNFLSNGVWGFGLDPDCHYYNDGIKFTITTDQAQVPEPSTLLLIGSGLVGLGAFRRRLFAK